MSLEHDTPFSIYQNRNVDDCNGWTVVLILYALLFLGPLFEPKSLSVSKKVLGLHYFDLMLPHLDTAEKVEGIIHPDITNVLCNFGQKQEDLGAKVSNTVSRNSLIGP